MESELRAGVAIYNAGEYHAAHDAWEDVWLDLERGTDDERFLHGLIQFTAAVYHARRANWEGVRGLARSAGEYLADLPDGYRGVNVGTVRRYLDRLARDPEHVERAAPPGLTYRGARLELADLEFESAAVAALVLAEDRERFDEGVLARATEFAREELRNAGTGRFVAMVMDFASDPANRDLIYQRLDAHVARREREARDVDGLFDA